MPAISWSIHGSTMVIGRAASDAYSDDASVREEIMRDAQIAADVRKCRIEVKDADEFPLFAAEPGTAETVPPPPCPETEPVLPESR